MFSELRYLFSRIKINWFDINFILVFIGFSFFTSFSEQSSVLYRALALGVAMICLFKNKKNSPIEKGNYFNFFIVILILFMLRALIGFYVGEYSSSYYSGGRNMAMLFGFGIMLIPTLVAVKGFNEMNQNTVLCLMLLLLIFMLSRAILGSAIEGNTGRFALNERQSTLSFGDNGAYLAILGACLLVSFKNFPIYRAAGLLKAVCVVAIVIGVLSAFRSGSRGPVMSMLAGLIFIFSTIGLKKNIMLLILGTCLMFAFNIDTFLENYAPVFFDRMGATMEEGDMNGRDEIFIYALRLIWDNPIFGSCPIILGRDSFIGFHNYYLTIGVGLGLFGLACIVGFVFVLLFRSYIHRFEIKTPFQLFILSMLCVISVRGITGVNPFADAVANTTYVFSAIMLWKSNLYNQE